MAAPPSTSAPKAPAPERATARRRAGLRRRSFLVRALRILAPLGIAVLAAVLVGWVVGKARRDRRAPAAPAPVSIHMTNPRFLGRDSRGRAFVLTGADAVRDDADAHLVHLVSPRLTLDSGAPRPFVVTAKTGLYRDDNHRLTMIGNVVTDDGRGNRFYSEAGEIDTDSGDVVGHDHVRAEGPSGTVESESYALSDKGDHATFTRNVKSRFYRDGSPTAPTPPVRKGP